MSISEDQVKKVAYLSRLAVTEEETKNYARELSRILALVEQMAQVSTSNVQPMAHPLNVTQRLREDVVTEKNEHEKFQAVAPAVDKGLYLVPKVIE